MSKGRIWGLLAATLLLASCTAMGPVPAGPAPLLRDQAAIEALKSGGYVIYMRHGHTDQAKDSNFADLNNCDTQRNLSPQGREESRAIGVAVRNLSIPVASVAASPFCRTRATAQLVFGAVRVEQRLNSYTGMPATQRDATNDYVRTVFGQAPPRGSNVVLVGHSPPFDAATQQQQPAEYRDKPFLNEGDAAVIRPDGQGGFSLVGHIGVKSWTQAR